MTFTDLLRNNTFRFISVGVLFFLLHIIFVQFIPLFNDESSYLHWGYILTTHLSDSRVPLALDGKQTATPLLFGLTTFLPFNVVLAARLPSIVFSSVTLLLLLKISGASSWKDTLLLFLLYSFSPYIGLFGTLALPESMVAFFYTAGFVIVNSEKANLNLAKNVVLGAIIGLGWWFKSSILIFFIPLILWRIHHGIKKRAFPSVLLQTSIVLCIFTLCISPLLIQDRYWQFDHFELTRIRTFVELLHFPVGEWGSSFFSIVQFIIFYGGPAMCSFLFFWHYQKKQHFSKIILFSLTPIFFETLFLKTIDARYVYPMVPLFILLSYFLLRNTSRKIWGSISLLHITFGVVFLLSPLTFYNLISFTPRVQGDFSQYVTGWPSGYGIKDAANYIVQEAGKNTAFVFIRLDSGNPEDGIAMYLLQYPNIKVLPLEYLSQVEQAKMTTSKKLFFVSRGNQFGNIKEKLDKGKVFSKPIGTEFVGVYRILDN